MQDFIRAARDRLDPMEHQLALTMLERSILTLEQIASGEIYWDKKPHKTPKTRSREVLTEIESMSENCKEESE